MGWIGRLVGQPTSSGTPLLLASGPPVEVKGEATYQAALSAICGGSCEDGHYKRVEAVLVPEPTNPYDGNAVKVLASATYNVGRAWAGQLVEVITADGFVYVVSGHKVIKRHTSKHAPDKEHAAFKDQRRGQLPPSA